MRRSCQIPEHFGKTRKQNPTLEIDERAFRISDPLSRLIESKPNKHFQISAAGNRLFQPKTQAFPKTELIHVGSYQFNSPFLLELAVNDPLFVFVFNAQSAFYAGKEFLSFRVRKRPCEILNAG